MVTLIFGNFYLTSISNIRFSDFISQNWEKTQSEVYTVLCSDYVFLNLGGKEREEILRAVPCQPWARCVHTPYLTSFSSLTPSSLEFHPLIEH